MIRRVLYSLLVVMLACGALAACGGPEEGALDESRERAAEQHGEETEEPTGATEDDAEHVDDDAAGGEDEAAQGDAGGEVSEQVLAEGRELFSARCASCHTLADADATGTVGPNLDQSELTVDGVVTKIQEGGGGMPAGLYTGEEAQTVAEYVVAVAGQ